jgi:hypothetical protein
MGQRQPGGTATSPLVGMMLVPNDQGLLIGRKQTNLNNAVPPQMDYGSAPVYKEHTFEFRPSGGMGESVQSSRTDHRYHYAMDCWVNGGLFGLGPLMHHETSPGVTGRVTRFIEARNAGVETLFYLAGDSVYRRDADGTQTRIHTRSGQGPTDAARFQGGYSGATDRLYVAWTDGVLEEYDGSAWATCTLPASFYAMFLCVLGDELWAADYQRCVIRKVTADPKVATNWGGPILVGNPSTNITALRQTTNRLCIFKSDGDVFTINGDGSDNDLFPGLQNTKDPENCRTAVAWQGSLWFRADRAFWQLDMQGGAVLTPVGPGRQVGNLSEVRGPVQAFAGWNSQMAFGAIFNSATNTSYLLTYGNWMPHPGDSGTDYAFASQWDGAIAHWPNRLVTALWVSNIPNNARLYIGFADGNYDWCTLVPYPLTPNSGGEYVTTGYVVAPLHHDMFQADTKQIIGFSVFGPSFPLQTDVKIGYRLRAAAGMPPSDPGGAYLSAGNPYTQNGQRQDLPTPVAGVALEMMVTLDTSSSAQTPVLDGIGLHERLVPAFRRDFQFTIDGKSVVARRDGASMRQSGRQIRDKVMEAAGSPGTIALELPEETIFDVALFDYVERMVPHTVRGGQGWAVDVQATQFGTVGLYGTIGRTRGNTIGSLRGWQIGQLRYF